MALPGNWTAICTVIEDHSVAAVIDAALPDFPRVADAWAALVWLLARNGKKMGLTRTVSGVVYRTYVQAGDEARTPSIAVLYEVHDDSIVVLAARIVPNE